MSGRRVVMYVASELADCVGVVPMKCFRVRYAPDDEWQLFYDEIIGFDFEPGFDYELSVEVTEVADPPADASSLRYELLDVLAKTPA